jgi:hypothetical protein
MSQKLPSLSLRAGGWLMHVASGLCESLARLESRVAADAIAPIKVRQPVFVAGLARSGSTILLEALASCPPFASLRYCDYPPVWFPYWWSQLRARLPLPAATPEERAHGDGIVVTPESPEAFDEVFWMHFFPDRHMPSVDQRLAADTENPRFADFYRLQIRKLLAARGKPRYLCKGNYNLARLPYLLKLFPDARFVVPIRAPEGHVASLIKQHRLFAQLGAQSPSVAAHLARTGHFEFGPQRRAECAGDPAEAARIEADFATDCDVSGYARQWAMSYGALAEALASDAQLAQATLLLRFEDLCREPVESLQRLARHVDLNVADESALIAHWAPRLRMPDYYSTTFSAEEQTLIARHCAAAAARFGYPAAADRPLHNPTPIG